jgi:LmeA-like phospholipid-binding
LLPSLLEGLVARNLRSGLGLAEAPEVNLVSDPAPSALLGWFEEGEITLTNPELGDVRPDEVKIHLAPFDLDVPASVAGGRIESKEPLSGVLWVELSEEEVARLAAFSETLAAPVSGVRLEEGDIVVGFEVEALGTRVPVGVEGEVVLRDGGELGFEANRLEVLGEPLPEQLTRRLLEGVDFAYPIELPFEGELSGVEAHEDRLVLTGEVSDLPAG